MLIASLKNLLMKEALIDLGKHLQIDTNQL